MARVEARSIRSKAVSADDYGRIGGSATCQFLLLVQVRGAQMLEMSFGKAKQCLHNVFANTQCLRGFTMHNVPIEEQ